MCSRPQILKAQKDSQLKQLFAQAGVNFTNILRAAFSYESLLSSFSVDTA